jgi:3-hydroxyisobutyrate dehydrogenase-like beta-hydroxyacid dehydrogenase
VDADGRPAVNKPSRLNRTRAGAAAIPPVLASARMADVDTTRLSVVGLLHPGEMGAAVGRCLTGRGHEVLWASAGRGRDTAARAAAAGLTDAGTIAELAGRAEVIICICPPLAAPDMAWALHGFGGLYVDANAISPGTAREVAQLISESGGRYVDGSVIGPPPTAPGRSRLYLSGTDAAQVAALFAGTPLDARVIAGPVTAASAVKMAYAGWTKGTAALLLTIRALAREQGVEDTLLAEWAMSSPELAGESRGAGRAAAAKGWRWVAEMEEIAATMSASGLPDGFHLAAAEIFRRTPRASQPRPDQPRADLAGQALEEVLTALNGDGTAT